MAPIPITPTEEAKNQTKATLIHMVNTGTIANPVCEEHYAEVPTIDN